MASNSPAGSVPEVPFGAAGAPSAAASHTSGIRILPQATADPGAFEVDAVSAIGTSGAPFDSFEEWNPTEDSVRPVRGKHRVIGKQRGGLARGGTVLGVGVIAAVGAGGMASAEDRPPVPVSMPDLGGLADDLAAQLPEATSLPGIGDLISGASDSPGPDGVTEASAGPLTRAGLSRSEAEQGRGAGDSLRDRILQQADRQESAAQDEARVAAEQAAVEQATRDAAADRQEADKAAAAKGAAEREARRKAEAAARAKAETERRAQLARSYVSPLTSYTLTAGFGQAGDRWVANHTGLDFAAPTGTPAKAVHGGTITQAGWTGAYGYRIVLTTDDGTELWFCHLSSIVRASGKVAAGEVIGRVGATGNVTGPHLHLEVRPGGGAPVDPKPWLREHGLDV
ncbi:peptidase [Streptomyces sp. WAC 06725]|uniref:M23 family metallopeptidase n=1 Tax=Streptomyces sp. WAC 06725 TaxID=2203209 RepID=UPI000F739904|nr:M23 family metallopeptidase [Streptomyces sp. WAC 06725]RSO14645.1 peptidase [Streptomyces sp. WAC 06725]